LRGKEPLAVGWEDKCAFQDRDCRAWGIDGDDGGGDDGGGVGDDDDDDDDDGDDDGDHDDDDDGDDDGDHDDDDHDDDADAAAATTHGASHVTCDAPILLNERRRPRHLLLLRNQHVNHAQHPASQTAPRNQHHRNTSTGQFTI